MVSTEVKLSIFHFKRLFFLMILYRLIILLIDQSSFVPDEYWQSLEVAHKTVFGYGYITWEWVHAIRSFFYPFWFAILYKILAFVNLDYGNFLVYIPRVMQAIMSAFTDVYFFQWSHDMGLLSSWNKHKVKWINFMWSMCLFVSYCSTRTLTNTLELNLTIIALYYFPWPLKNYKGNSHKFVWLVGVSCLARPTAAILWIPLCFYNLAINERPFIYFLDVYLRRIFKLSFICILIDLFFYKRIVFTPLNFFLYNFTYNIGDHYGVHTFFWYFTSGIPVVLGPLCVPFYLTVIKIGYTLIKYLYSKHIGHTYCIPYTLVDILLFSTVLWTIFWYSLISHKEFRFILSLTPIMFYLAVINFKSVSSLQHVKCLNFAQFVRSSCLLSCITLSMVLFNIFGIFYLGRWHQTGSLKVMSILAQEAATNPKESNFLFLMPCHSTPLYSHLHVNVPTRFLTCEPNFNHQPFYKDEADLFYENPINWLLKHYSDTEICALPSHIILFSDLRSEIIDFLNLYKYSLWQTEFHTHFAQVRQSEYIEIFHLNFSKSDKCFL